MEGGKEKNERMSEEKREGGKERKEQRGTKSALESGVSVCPSARLSRGSAIPSDRLSFSI